MNHSTFVDFVSNYLIENYRTSLFNTTVVFPNKRAGIYLQQSLAKQFDSPTWLPNILSFEEFLKSCSDFNFTSSIENNIALFKIHNQHCEKEELDSFLQWSTVLLNDFNNVLESLADGESLFTSVNHAKKIEEWNPSKKEFTELQSKYLSFWDKLEPMYNDFLYLNKSGQISTKSYAENWVANNVDQWIKRFNNQTIFLCGFSSLTESQIKIFDTLKNTKKCTFIWDFNLDYFNNWKHSAGLGLRKSFKRLKINADSEIIFKKSIKEIQNINVYKCSGPNDQSTKLSINLENAIQQQERTAVVLPDQNLISATLNYIPKKISSFNLTIGYPIKQTEFFSFLLKLVEIGKVISGKKININHALFVSLISDSWLSKFISKNEFNSTVELLTNKNILHVSEQHLNEIIKLTSSGVLLLVYDVFKKQTEGTFYELNSFLENLEPLIIEELNQVEKETFIDVLTQLEKVTNLLSLNNISSNVATYSSLIIQLISSNELTIKGEPLKGLQILGMLETRNLDFENLHVLSVNEGVLPKSSVNESFIPLDIQKAYGLTTFTEKDNFYSYHFYRLIQRAKSVYLYYDSTNQSFSKGEKSRYISQLENSNYNIINHNSFKHNDDKAKGQVEVYKTDDILRKIRFYLTIKGVSPSALITYLENPLEFYLRYIEQVYEEDTIEYILESSSIGDIIHGLLEDIYSPFVGSYIDYEKLELYLKEIPKLVDYKFLQNFNGQQNIGGKNGLLKKVIEKLTMQFISNEIKAKQKIKLVGLEQKLTATIKVKSLSIKLKGIIDRVEIRNGVHHIIDYKTGKVDLKDLTLNNVSEVFNETLMEVKSKSTQLLFYGLMFKKNYLIDKFKTAILPIRSPKSEMLFLNVNQNQLVNFEHINQFEVLLKTVFIQMLDKKVPFAEKGEPRFKPFYHL